MIMEHITDPRILEIMAQLSHNAEAGGGRDPQAPPLPEARPLPTLPITVEEFMQTERLCEWPHRITSEGPMDLSEERNILANRDDVVQELAAATPVDIELLKEAEVRLENFEERVKLLSKEILANADGDWRKGAGADDGSEPPRALSKAFMRDISDLNILQIAPCSRSSRKKDFIESAKESKRKSVENCSFPGYRHSELTPLPGQLEGPQLLHRVTKVQDFNPGFRKFWKKIFQSEASVAVMQDSFWWLFIQNFRCDEREAQSKLFDRIADSFVALFTTVNPEVKDKIFAVYADCLAQAIFVAFYEAFPESRRHMQDAFKEQLATTTSEWVSGIRPAPGSWKRWNVRLLEPTATQSAVLAETGKPSTGIRRGQSSRGPLMLPAHGRQSLDMDEFYRLMQSLGGDVYSTGRESVEEVSSSLARQGTITSISGIAREPTERSQIASLKDTTGLRPVSGSRETHGSLPKKKLPDSHQMGPGPDLERVMFNTYGRSPLVSHYLKMRQLTDGNETSRKIRRTEIVGYPPEGPTYRDLINETMARSDLLSQEYQKVCEQTAQDMLKLEQQKRDSNHQIAQLQKEILFCKNSVEIKILSEEIMEKNSREQRKSKPDSTKRRQEDEEDDF